MKKIIGLVLGLFGLIAIIVLLSNNAKAVSCEDEMSQWQCSGSVQSENNLYIDNVNFKKDSGTNFQTVLDHEYTSNLKMDDTDFKAMVEFNYDSADNDDYNVGTGTALSQSTKTSGCSEISVIWTGSIEGQSFKWKQAFVTCELDGSPDYAWFYDLITFDSDPGGTYLILIEHKSSPMVYDSTNYVYIYHLTQSAAWAEPRNEITIEGLTLDGTYSASLKVAGASDTSYGTLYYDPEPGSCPVYLYQVNHDPGYSDSTPWLANTGQDTQNTKVNVWIIWASSVSDTTPKAWGPKMVPRDWPA